MTSDNSSHEKRIYIADGLTAAANRLDGLWNQPAWPRGAHRLMEAECASAGQFAHMGAQFIPADTMPGLHGIAESGIETDDPHAPNQAPLWALLWESISNWMHANWPERFGDNHAGARSWRTEPAAPVGMKEWSGSLPDPNDADGWTAHAVDHAKAMRFLASIIEGDAPAVPDAPDALASAFAGNLRNWFTSARLMLNAADGDNVRKNHPPDNLPKQAENTYKALCKRMNEAELRKRYPDIAESYELMTKYRAALDEMLWPIRIEAARHGLDPTVFTAALSQPSEETIAEAERMAEWLAVKAAAASDDGGKGDQVASARSTADCTSDDGHPLKPLRFAELLECSKSSIQNYAKELGIERAGHRGYSIADALKIARYASNNARDRKTREAAARFVQAHEPRTTK